MKMTMGMHIIMEMYGCPSELIAHTSTIKRIFDEIIRAGQLNRISEAYHQFKPEGVTAIVLLEESHISVHTWPEFGYVAMDIYTCGNTTKAEAAAVIAKKLFRPKKVLEKTFSRGLEHETTINT
ncbi:MAG: adenosylmethionine decarboxylase [Candidatus Diapherotrites archaeon]